MADVGSRLATLKSKRTSLAYLESLISAGITDLEPARDQMLESVAQLERSMNVLVNVPRGRRVYRPHAFVSAYHGVRRLPAIQRLAARPCGAPRRRCHGANRSSRSRRSRAPSRARRSSDPHPRPLAYARLLASSRSRVTLRDLDVMEDG